MFLTDNTNWQHEHVGIQCHMSPMSIGSCRRGTHVMKIDQMSIDEHFNNYIHVLIFFW